MPLLNSGRFRPYYAFFFALFILDFCLLTYIGGAPIEPPYYFIGQLATAFYFSYFLIIIPGLAIWENYLFEEAAEAQKKKEEIVIEFLKYNEATLNSSDKYYFRRVVKTFSNNYHKDKAAEEEKRD
jgi:hypothetical protein